MPQVILKSLTRVAIISILPAENVSNAELEAALKEHLKSKLFSVDRVAIIDDQEDAAASNSTSAKQE
jgi:hypothetical protein